jgi:tetratricopeptide (TPR) repeat protein
VPVATAATPAAAPGTLTPDRLVALQQEGRDAMLNGDYEAAIRAYTRLLQEPGEHRAEAREYLGLARERNGQIAHASAEYRAYLAEYPEGEGARRVRQRLNGLSTAAALPRDPLRKGVEEQSNWDFATGLSQYYRRDVAQFDEDLPQIVSLEAVFTDLDFSVRHSGDSVDVQSRIVVSNLYDLMDSEIQSRTFSDPNRVSYAYFDVNQADGTWMLRTGRQTLHNWGVLGRFDGLHFAYDWAPDRRVHFTSGFPVESTRNGLDRRREFYGVAVDFDHLVGAWDFSVFANQGMIEGIDDRQAVGMEAHYIDDKRSLTSLLDYDYGYSELNTALVLATWRFDNRLTLTGLLESRSSPVLTTRNALIGQPVTSIDELLLVWTEDEIRQIAQDRTTDSATITLGLAKPIFERFQVNADVTATEIGDTIASFGVPAIPGTGQQVYYSTSLVGSALFGTGDVSIFNLRYGVADDFTTAQLTYDVRFPVGRRLRLNPRLRYAVWESTDGRERETTSASFRLLLNLRNRYRLEAEFGSDEFLRTDRTFRQDATGNYVNVGYRADF